ncbi:hypothetical protein SCUCBS95973_006882 [Sporothrix curviconia]|uniref:Uncharacterized protein n=1 Tax=Sporothrix curviconia TaxID=1260050 RepID=A0ABP0C8T9_9PEZI
MSPNPYIRLHYTTCGTYLGPHIEEGKNGSEPCCTTKSAHACCLRRPEQNCLEFYNQRARIINGMRYHMPSQEALQYYLNNGFCYTTCFNNWPVIGKTEDGRYQAVQYMPFKKNVNDRPAAKTDDCGSSDASITATAGGDVGDGRAVYVPTKRGNPFLSQEHVLQRPGGARRGDGITVANDADLSVSIDNNGLQPPMDSGSLSRFPPIKAGESSKTMTDFLATKAIKVIKKAMDTINDDKSSQEPSPESSGTPHSMSGSEIADKTADKGKAVAQADYEGKGKGKAVEEPEEVNATKIVDKGKDVVDKGKAAVVMGEASGSGSCHETAEIRISKYETLLVNGSVDCLVAREYDTLAEFYTPGKDDGADSSDTYDVDSHSGGDRNSVAGRDGKDADNNKKDGLLTRLTGHIFGRSN